MLIVGSHPSFKFRWPPPTHGPGLLPLVTLGDAIAGLPQFGTDAADALYHIRPAYAARAYAGHTGSTPGKPSKTLVSGCNAPPGGANMVRSDDVTCRQYSIREFCRVQSLPDSFVVPTSASKTQASWQLGNMVPYLLGRAIARALREILGQGATSQPVETLAHAGVLTSVANVIAV